MMRIEEEGGVLLGYIEGIWGGLQGEDGGGGVRGIGGKVNKGWFFFLYIHSAKS